MKIVHLFSHFKSYLLQMWRPYQSDMKIVQINPRSRVKFVCKGDCQILYHYIADQADSTANVNM